MNKGTAIYHIISLNTTKKTREMLMAIQIMTRTGTKMWRIKPVNGIPTLPLLTIRCTMATQIATDNTVTHACFHLIRLNYITVINNIKISEYS